MRNCVELASMITGQFSNQIFAKEEWNAKLNTYFKENFGSESQIDRFVSVLSDGEAINTMNLNRLFVLTTSESASASELLINGLAPFIEVIQIGEQTVGKNVGSITVYDYVNNQERTKNPELKEIDSMLLVHNSVLQIQILCSKQQKDMFLQHRLKLPGF